MYTSEFVITQTIVNSLICFAQNFNFVICSWCVFTSIRIGTFQSNGPCACWCVTWEAVWWQLWWSSTTSVQRCWWQSKETQVSGIYVFMSVYIPEIKG